MMSRFAILPAILPALVASSARDAPPNQQPGALEDQHASKNGHPGKTSEDDVPNLTLDNWREVTKGKKTIFVRFVARGCADQDEDQDDAWSAVAKKFGGVYDFPCAPGAKFCEANKCSIKYGDPSDPRNLDLCRGKCHSDLMAFAQNLFGCNVDDQKSCGEDMKTELHQLQGMPLSEQRERIKNRFDILQVQRNIKMQDFYDEEDSNRRVLERLQQKQVISMGRRRAEIEKVELDLATLKTSLERLGEKNTPTLMPAPSVAEDETRDQKARVPRHLLEENL